MRPGGTGGRGGRPPIPIRPSFWDWLLGLFQPARPDAVPRRSLSLSEQEARVLAEFGHHYKIDFNDPDLLRLALTHRSYLSVTGQGPRESNERLEFLGDSVLGLVTSEYLYRQHPNEHEGQLTKTKSLLVSKAILSRRGLAMGLGRFVLMSHSEVESGGRQRLSIIADAFEAVLGAIYLDQGFEAARAFVERWLLRDYREIAADKRHTNYKSHLQEYVQSNFRTHPVYRIRSQMGPDHSKQFMVEVMVGRRVLGSGRGRNKKEAEQAAARDAIERVRPGGTGVEHPPEREREPERGVLIEAPFIPESEPEPEAEPRAPRAPRRSEARTPEVVPAAEPEDEASSESDDAPRRRRGRRGGRGRRGRGEGAREPREARPAIAPVERVESEESEPEAAAPRTREREPEVVRPRERERARPRSWAEPAPPAPTPVYEPEVEPPPRAYEEDENEEVGRPEGPLEDRGVDPFGFGAERAPAPPEAEEPEEEWSPPAPFRRELATTEEDDEEESVEAPEVEAPEAEAPEEQSEEPFPPRAHTEDNGTRSPAPRAPEAAPAKQGPRFGRRPGRGSSRGGRRAPVE